MLFVWGAPYFTPWDEQPQILQPARAQAAWMYVWMSAFTWFPFQAAILGRRLRTHGVLEFLRARGVRAGSMYAQIGAALAVWFGAVVLFAGGMCLSFCQPRLASEAQQWTLLVAQCSVLAVVAFLPLLWLGIALGTRLDEVLAFLIPVSLLFLGLFAAPWIAPLLVGSDAPLFRLAWLLSPHTHLADLTARLVFKMGPLAGSDFIDSLTCLTLQGVAITLTGRCLIRTSS